MTLTFQANFASSRGSVHHGFTLIELAVVVAIMGILSAIAIPAYTQYVTQARLTQAVSDLASYRLRMEKAYQDNNNYGVGACSVALPPADGYFTMTCALTNGGQGFVVTATGSSRASGYTYTLDDQNGEATTQFKGSAVAKSCWLIKGAEC